MSKVIVHTTCMAQVSEDWVIEVPEGTDVDTANWTTGWEDAIKAGLVRKLGVTQTETAGHVQRVVVKVEAL